MRYLHAVPFLKNEMIFSILKTPKTHAFFGGVQRSKCPEFGKMAGKNPQLCPFTGLSCPCLVIPHMPLFSRISPASEYIVKANRKHKTKPGPAQTELSCIRQTVAGIM